MGSSWSIKNRKGEAQITGLIIMGEGEFQDNRISGSVEVIDGGKNRTRAGLAFWSAAYISTAAGQYPTVQLWNPLGSGRVLVIEQIIVSAAVSGSIRAGLLNAAIGASALQATNKLTGGPASYSDVRTADLPNKPYQTMFDFFIQAGVPQVIRLSEPLILTPGNGFCIHAGAAAGQAINNNIEFYEEPL
jgi:hypothetical protein